MTHRNSSQLLALAILLAATQLQAQDEPKMDPAQDKPIINFIGMKLMLLPPGTLVMGSDSGVARDSEKTAHKATSTKPFDIGVHEVTQAQFEKVMGNNRSRIKGSQNPLESVSWEDAIEFCGKVVRFARREGSGPHVSLANGGRAGVRQGHDVEQWPSCTVSAT